MNKIMTVGEVKELLKKSDHNIWRVGVKVPHKYPSGWGIVTVYYGAQFPVLDELLKSGWENSLECEVVYDNPLFRNAEGKGYFFYE